MSDTGIKPRWKAWENICIEKAFQQKIQLKIIALGMGRTVTSVNKKIRALGLRKPNNKCGRTKGSGFDVSLTEKLIDDRKKMTKIIEDYAPLRYQEKRTLNLTNGCWSLSSSEAYHDALWHKTKTRGSATFTPPFTYELSNEEIPMRQTRQTDMREPVYVPIKLVEQWAEKEGFHQLKKGLRQKGLHYWKSGQYFSNAQLLIYLNHRRFEKRLHPITIYDDVG